MAIRSFRGLDVWNIAMDLVDEVYVTARAFPDDERFGLTSQLRRSAVSVPSNIAEGQARWSTPEFLRHLSIACGSLAEAETQIEIARRQEFTTQEEAERLYELAARVRQMIYRLRRSLQP